MHRNTLILCLLLTIIAACTPVSKPVQITATPDLPTLTIYEVEIAPTSLQITATPPVFPTRIPENPPTTAPPIPPPPQEVAEIPIPQGDAQVAQDSGDLRLRSEPRRADNIITLLDEFTPLDIIGRTDDNFWLEVIIPDGRRGWVMAQFVDVHVDLNSITSVVEPQPDVQPVDVAGVVSNITGKSNEIFANGQARGNRANVFSKVGDSLTVATYTLYPVGWGQYNLRGYGNLQSVVNYFSSATARDSNSYANTSLAADNGWTSADILDPGRANPGVC
ncbi:MAG TPA: SH3 domain-containing protein, partial [Aggregatilineales bacterium]|nr:SH3 domain-containing protein [Aggregatilineales bacterium]